MLATFAPALGFSYTGDAEYDSVLLAAFLLSAQTVVAAFFMDAPYGKLSGDSGSVLDSVPKVNPRLGWWLMELPATLSFFWYVWSENFSYHRQLCFLTTFLLESFAGSCVFLPRFSCAFHRLGSLTSPLRTQRPRPLVCFLHCGAFTTATGAGLSHSL